MKTMTAHSLYLA